MGASPGGPSSPAPRQGDSPPRRSWNWNWNWGCAGSPAKAAASSDWTWNWTWCGQDVPTLNVNLHGLPSMRSIERALQIHAPPFPLTRAGPGFPAARHRHHAAVHRSTQARKLAPALRPVAGASAVSTAPPPAGSRRAPAAPRHRPQRAGPPSPENPSPLPQLPGNQAVGAGSSGGSSTPPPAPLAALLAAACFSASMLVSRFWNAHRRRRSRLFASRLERPG